MDGKSDHILLPTIVHAKHMKAFGNSAVFNKVIDDLNDLSRKGLIVYINGSKQTIHFACPLILGDNLGANTIEVFSQSFQANYYCRICNCPKNVCKNCA